jgi:dihydroxyacetone kinase-like predicted kinase
MLDDVVVENMDLQYANLRRASQNAATPTADPLGAASLSMETVTGLGIVAVASGEGLADHFRALGASQIVSGGQSMNPSAEDLLNAIHAVQANHVILLPNNKNVILAANQARDLAQDQSDKKVYVVPTRSVPQGFAALMALDYSADAAANAETMCEDMHDVVTVEVTTAVRTTNINGIQIHEGQQIGLLDGQILISAVEDLQVLQGILDQIDLSSYEVAMIYYGAERTSAQCQDMMDSLAQRYPQMHFEMHPGGQPYYAYLLSIE